MKINNLRPYLENIFHKIEIIKSIRLNKILKKRIILEIGGIFLIAGIIIIFYINSRDVCKNTFDEHYMNKGLVLYFQFNNNSHYGENDKIVCDLSGNKNIGYAYNAEWNSTGGYIGDGAFEFNGIDSIIKIKDNSLLSPSTFRGNLTVSFFIQFKNTNFIGEGSGKDYINFLGKGSKEKGYEWLFREYNSSNLGNRPNRISIYAYNPEGGIGSGAYFQDSLRKNEWIYVTGVIEENTIKIYKNGVFRNVEDFSKNNISIIDTDSDLYIGSVNQVIYLNGSIDELRIYNRALSDSDVKNLYDITISTLYPE